MHMATSAIPGDVVARLRSDPRVERSEPILYVTAVLGDETPSAVYLIGYRDAGGPWAMAEGREPRGAGEIVIDERAAERLGVRVGEPVRALGGRLRVVGLARGTASVVTSVAFVAMDAFREAARTGDNASYLLAWPREGVSPAELARGLEGDYPVTAQTREQFSDEERRIVSDMSTGLIRGMLVIGFVVGLVVAALSMYTATTARLREYAVLKAIGMRNRALYGVVSRQAALTVGAGFLASLALLGLLVALIPLASPSVTMVVSAGSVARVALITAAIALVAALLPARRVARVDPASVYRE